jgi:hypothetical protein
VALVRAWQRSELRVGLRERRLRLAGLSRPVQALVIGALVVDVLLGAALLWARRGGHEPPPVTNTTANLAYQWPAPTILVLLSGIAMSVAALAAAGVRSERAVWRRTLLGLAAGLAVVSVALVWRGFVLDLGLYDKHDGVTRAAAVLAPTVAAVAGVLVVAGLLLSRRRGGLTVVLLTMPVVLLAVFWACLRLAGGELSGPVRASLADQVAPSVIAEFWISTVVLVMGGLAMAVTLWQVAEGARAAQDVARAGALGLARAVRRVDPRSRARASWWLVATLLLLKAVWVAAGLATALPAALGGDVEVWDTVRHDGLLSWGLAVLAAVVVAAWIRAGSPGPADRRGLAAAAVLVVGVLTIGEVAFQVLGVTGVAGRLDWATNAALGVEGIQEWTIPLSVAVAAVVAGTLAWRGTHGAAVLMLTAYAVWGAIRSVAIARDLASYPWYPFTPDVASESGSGERAGWVSLASVDTALTVVLAVIAVLAARRLLAASLVAVVGTAVASSVVVYAGVLGDALVAGHVGNAVAFLLPFVYLYLADSKELSHQSPERERRVLTVVALSTLALTVGLMRGVRGDPIAGIDVDLATAMLVFPLLVTGIVLATGRRPLLGRDTAALLDRERHRLDVHGERRDDGVEQGLDRIG